jgi:hypothetical protein
VHAGKITYHELSAAAGRGFPAAAGGLFAPLATVFAPTRASPAGAISARPSAEPIGKLSY